MFQSVILSVYSGKIMTKDTKSAKQKVTKRSNPAKKSSKADATASTKPLKNESEITPKIQKLRANLKKVIEEFITSKKYRPLSENEMAEKLSIIPDHIPIFKEILKEILTQHQVTIKQEKLYPKTSSNLTTGTIRMHPRGFGFVEADDPLADDIFIPKPFTKNAIDGDQVEVAISPLSISDKGPEGKVIAILSRSRTHLAGIVTYVSRKAATVYVPL